MILYPAIDLRQGQVVRLREGDLAQQTVFSDDPLATALHWAEQSATWLHIVNLDGAFAQASDNASIMARIGTNQALAGVKKQFAGGIRTLENIEQVLDVGADRVVIGTAAVENPTLVEEAVAQFGAERICIALDARDGKVVTRGWQTASERTPVDFGLELAAMGVRHALFTDVSRDGLLTGANVAATVALARDTGLAVIASGGINGLDDLAQLNASGVVAGAVIGMALYQGRFTLRDAQTSVGA